MWIISIQNLRAESKRLYNIRILYGFIICAFSEITVAFLLILRNIFLDICRNAHYITIPDGMACERTVVINKLYG